MRFHYANLETCHEATGTVVVIDVIRAFTNAAMVFSRGAEKIYPVSTVEEALRLKAQVPDSLACGEVGGLPPAGFDFGNSPTQTKELELGGRSVIQRTGAGTQGIVRSVHADVLLAASLAVAGATVRYIRKLEPASVTFVVTGQFEDGRGDEDLACAEFLAQRLLGRSPDLSPYLKRVTSSRDALLHLDPDLPAFPRSDLDYCAGIDTFDFAMPVNREDGRHVIRPARM